MVTRFFLLVLLLICLTQCKVRYYRDLVCDCSSDSALILCLQSNLKGADKQFFTSKSSKHEIVKDSVKIRYMFFTSDLEDTIANSTGYKRNYVFDFDKSSGNCIWQNALIIHQGKFDKYAKNQVNTSDTASIIIDLLQIVRPSEHSLLTDSLYERSFSSEGNYIFLEVHPIGWFQGQRIDKRKRTILSYTIDKHDGRIVEAYKWKSSNYKYSRRRF